MSNLAEQCAPFYQSAGFAVMPPRTRIEITGADAKRFLHNYCTADILKLQPNHGTELFITSVKGKVLGYGVAFCRENGLILETVAGQAEKLINHLDRYTLSDDVELKDVSDGWKFLYVGGPQAADALHKVTGDQPPTDYLQWATSTGESRFDLSRGGAVSPHGFTIVCGEDELKRLRQLLSSQGVAEVAGDVLEVLRIESGMPEFGLDITEDNLPQEVNRNAQAISFTKGCYLGQETVARLDALGHVNKLLVGVQFSDSEIPNDGAQLLADAIPAGTVTSAVFSPRLSAPLALAYVKTKQGELPATLSFSGGAAEIVRLPIGD